MGKFNYPLFKINFMLDVRFLTSNLCPSGDKIPFSIFLLFQSYWLESHNLSF